MLSSFGCKETFNLRLSISLKELINGSDAMDFRLHQDFSSSVQTKRPCTTHTLLFLGIVILSRKQSSRCKTLIGSHNLSGKRNHRRIAPMTGSARNRLPIPVNAAVIHIRGLVCVLKGLTLLSVIVAISDDSAAVLSGLLVHSQL